MKTKMLIDSIMKKKHDKRQHYEENKRYVSIISKMVTTQGQSLNFYFEKA